ncbi:MAG TPA: zeta toxin family protein [Candidatus Binatia bacterium]|nr:zeta toxin family protein [Candidatus Binatia bacterium]
MSAGLPGAIRAALSTQPVLVFLAGPNGAGKTTFFEAYLERLGIANVNADRIARILRARDPRAGQELIDRRALREADRLRRALLEARLSFCTETVFSDPVGARLRFLEKARSAGFAVFLIFIGLQDPLLSVARVRQRVLQGGHAVPEEKLHARFPRTLANLRAAIPIVDEAFLFDNSSYDFPYRPVAAYRGGRLVSRHPPLPPWAAGLPGLDAAGGR